MTKNFQKYQDPNQRCIIKSNTYSKTFAHVTQLVAEAKADFPDLEDDQIEIFVYGDRNWKGQTGIEFRAPTMHLDYCEITELPTTHN